MRERHVGFMPHADAEWMLHDMDLGPETVREVLAHGIETGLLVEEADVLRVR
jgi:hypothetical protein